MIPCQSFTSIALTQYYRGCSTSIQGQGRINYSGARRRKTKCSSVTISKADYQRDSHLWHLIVEERMNSGTVVGSALPISRGGVRRSFPHRRPIFVLLESKEIPNDLWDSPSVHIFSETVNERKLSLFALLWLLKKHASLIQLFKVVTRLRVNDAKPIKGRPITIALCKCLTSNLTNSDTNTATLCL